MRLTQIAYLHLPQIYLSAKNVHILPAVKERCLISVGKLCDDGFGVIFDTKKCFHEKGNLVLLVIDVPKKENNPIKQHPKLSVSLYGSSSPKISLSINTNKLKRYRLIYIESATLE